MDLRVHVDLFYFFFLALYSNFRLSCTFHILLKAFCYLKLFASCCTSFIPLICMPEQIKYNRNPFLGYVCSRLFLLSIVMHFSDVSRRQTRNKMPGHRPTFRSCVTHIHIYFYLLLLERACGSAPTYSSSSAALVVRLVDRLAATTSGYQRDPSTATPLRKHTVTHMRRHREAFHGASVATRAGENVERGVGPSYESVATIAAGGGAGNSVVGG